MLLYFMKLYIFVTIFYMGHCQIVKQIIFFEFSIILSEYHVKLLNYSYFQYENKYNFIIYFSIISCTFINNFIYRYVGSNIK